MKVTTVLTVGIR